MAADESPLSPGGLPMPIPMIQQKLNDLHQRLVETQDEKERKNIRREIEAYEIQLKARSEVAAAESQQTSDPPLAFGELPKTLKENEDELARLKQELPRAADERAKALRSRIEALEKNRYAFSSHGGPPGDETLAEAEDRLLGEISELEQQLAKTSDPEERKRITAAIDGRKAGLDAVLAEKEAGRSDPPKKTSTLLDFTSEFSLDQPTRLILEFIQNDLLKATSQPYPEITPHIFFYAAILRTEIGPKFHSDADALVGLVQLNADELRAHIGSALSSQPAEKRNYSLMVSSEMIEVAERAVSLALETTGRRTILLRHLLVAALTFRNPLEYLFFTRLGIEAKRVVHGFLDYLRNKYPGDDAQAWTNAFKDTSRLSGINLSIEDLAVAEQSEKNENFEPAVLQIGSRYRLEPQILTLIQKALDLPSSSNLGHQLAQITPVGLLLMAIIQGAAGPGLHPDCYYLADFYINSGGATTDDLRTLLLQELVGPAAAGSPAQQFPKVTEDTLDFAQQLAVAVTGEKTICMRHLLGGICLLVPGWGSRVSKLLKDAHLSVEETSSKLLNYFLQVYRGDNAQAWIAEFGKVYPSAASSASVDKAPTAQEPTKFQIGAQLHFSKTATTEEMVLGVDGYAGVLTSLIRSADEKDLCLAIFGAWGRGKTFLMDQTVTLLEKQNAKEKSVYKHVKFSAWKFPSRPEVWIYLFQTFFESLRAHGFAGWFRSFAFVIRFGLLRNGVFPLVGAWVALVVTALPKFAAIKSLFHYFLQLEATVAIAAVIFLALFLSRFWKTALLLKRHFFSATDHAEKLGLQATIGKDLRALLEAWVQVDNRSRATSKALAWFSWACSTLSWVVAWRAWHAPEIVIVINGFLLLMVLFTIAAFYFSAKAPHRLFLVVDDLDRCQFDHLLTIIESIKLLLEETEISKRVQVVMLMEEDVLKHAIWEKYRRLLSPRAKGELRTQYSSQRLIRENCDKLFTAHLRLGGLRLEEIDELILHFGGKPKESPDKAVKSQSDDKVTTGESVAANRQPITASGASTESPTSVLTVKTSSPTPLAAPAPAPNKADFVREMDAGCSVTRKEKEVVQKVVRDVFKDKAHELGPRGIRAFLFRYQLARMILEEIGNTTWTPTMVANMIAHRTLTGEIEYLHQDDPGEEVKRVVEQVA